MMRPEGGGLEGLDRLLNGEVGGQEVDAQHRGPVFFGQPQRLPDGHVARDVAQHIAPAEPAEPLAQRPAEGGDIGQIAGRLFEEAGRALERRQPLARAVGREDLRPRFEEAR